MDWIKHDTCEYDCPHCGVTDSLLAKDCLYIDDVADGLHTQCKSCRGLYQLRCVSVEVEMEAITKEVK